MEIQTHTIGGLMQRHSDKCSTQDSTASLLSAACSNYELFSIILCMWHARFS